MDALLVPHLALDVAGCQYYGAARTRTRTMLHLLCSNLVRRCVGRESADLRRRLLQLLKGSHHPHQTLDLRA